MTVKINPRMKRTTTMLRAALLALALVFCFTPPSLAQESGGTPKDMVEVGVNGGYLFVAGDVTPKFGYGYGLHVRKATDYMFSLRLDLVGGTAKGDNAGSDPREFELDWLSGTALGVFSLNNFRFDRRTKKVNYYAMAGVGANYYMSEFSSEGMGNPRRGTVPREWAPHVAIGAGISFRLGRGVNIGLEHQAFSLFGQRSDKLDGIFQENNVRSAFSDILNFSSLQINFNLGNPSNRSEPLYWASPMESFAKDMDELRRQQSEALADEDDDGVIDAIDQEPNTPSGVPVDTKGRTLDSDNDGVADYEDKEPYYPPRAGERVNEDGVVVNPITPTGGVTEERVQEMIDEALANYGLTEPKNNVAEWFLPMVHFATDSYTIKYSDYGTLAGIARMLKGNPDMRLVVTGFTDQTGSESVNNNLSYQRAHAIIDHLVNQHGIGRGRLVLQWKGQVDPLVPQAASYMNRRVEFRVATSSDVEMDPPNGEASPKEGGNTKGY